MQQAALRDLMAGREPSRRRRGRAGGAAGRDACGAGVDVNDFERALARFMAQHLAPGSQPDAAMFNAMLRLMFDFGITMPAEWSTFFRALIVLEGTLTTIAPGYSVIDAAESIAAKWVRSLINPSSMQQAVRDELLRTVPMLRRLPRHIDRAFTSLERDGLRVRVSHFSDEHDERVVTQLVNRVVLAFLVGRDRARVGRPDRDRRRPGVLRQHVAVPGLRLLRAVLRHRPRHAGDRGRAARRPELGRRPLRLDRAGFVTLRVRRRALREILRSEAVSPGGARRWRGRALPEPSCTRRPCRWTTRRGDRCAQPDPVNHAPLATPGSAGGAGSRRAASRSPWPPASVGRRCRHRAAADPALPIPLPIPIPVSAASPAPVALPSSRRSRCPFPRSRHRQLPVPLPDPGRRPSSRHWSPWIRPCRRTCAATASAFSAAGPGQPAPAPRQSSSARVQRRGLVDVSPNVQADLCGTGVGVLGTGSTANCNTSQSASGGTGGGLLGINPNVQLGVCGNGVGVLGSGTTAKCADSSVVRWWCPGGAGTGGAGTGVAGTVVDAAIVPVAAIGDLHRRLAGLHRWQPPDLGDRRPRPGCHRRRDVAAPPVRVQGEC